jgi:hypothetical protein
MLDQSKALVTTLYKPNPKTDSPKFPDMNVVDWRVAVT